MEDWTVAFTMTKRDVRALYEQIGSIVPRPPSMNVLSVLFWVLWPMGTITLLWLFAVSLKYGYTKTAIISPLGAAALILVAALTVRHGGVWGMAFWRIGGFAGDWWSGPMSLSVDAESLILKGHAEVIRLAWADVDSALVTEDFVFVGRFNGEGYWVWAPLRAFDAKTPLALLLNSVQSHGDTVPDASGSVPA
ncbi:MAG: hypothetical protein U1E29_15880 [Coriobacteriia bacterium]|nr:hypothetical protein [Coriobacteriia bacterium]